MEFLSTRLNILKMFDLITIQFSGDSSYKGDSLSGNACAKISDWELRTSLHSFVETCQDVNKHKEDQLIILTPVTNLHECVHHNPQV